MKIVLLGDLHIGGRNDSLVFSLHVKKFFDDLFFPYLIENDIKTVIQVGDIFDRRKYINFKSLYDSKKYFFKKLSDFNINLVTIPGNHDIYYKDTLEVNALDLLLREYKNIEIILTPQEKEIDGVKFLFLPWICEENEQASLEAVNNSTANFCVGHLQLVGYEMRRGVLSDHGHNAKLFNKFEKVYTGHFHHQSLIGNIFYIGTPYEIDWSDYDELKGFHVFDTETHEDYFVKNDKCLFYKIDYNEKDYNIDNVKDLNFTQYKNTYVKVIVKNKTNQFLFDLFIDKLERAEVYDLQIVEESLLTQLDEIDIDVDQTQDTLTIMYNFIDQMETSIERNSIKMFLNELYTEAYNRE
jgi:DNA repair exonuclease SbcCD nuclease subunit